MEATPPIKTRYAAELLRIYVDDAFRAFDGATPTVDPEAAVNEAAGRVVNYAIALRDVFRNAYR